MWLYCLGFFVHFILILGVVDIFFQNYISSSEWKCENIHGVAKRLVFILADGLDEYQLKARATGNVAVAINGNGTWGSILAADIASQYSGNQALLSGFTTDPFTTYFSRFIYEPEAFDNFMNRSESVFYIGTKDVYDSIYKRRQNSWWKYFYPDWESSIISNFSTSELSNLTIGQTEDLFSASRWNKTLKEMLNQNKTTFFIQLSFVARAGQLFGFNSNYTYSAIDNLFSTIENIVTLMENYYKRDEKTVYILCSSYRPDDGYRTESISPEDWNKYPFVAWGQGIASNREKTVIRQIDITAMVSALLGLTVPSNSRGIIPKSVVDLNQEDMAQAQICNAMHLYNLALETESSVPFNLSSHTYSSDFINGKLKNYIIYKKYTELNNVITALTDLSLKKINFNESVFKVTVWYCTVLILFSWIFLICSEMLPYRDSFDNKSLISFSEIKLRVAYGLNNINNHMLSAIRKKKFTKQVRTEESGINAETKQLQEGSSMVKAVQIQPNENLKLSMSNTIHNENLKRRTSVIKWKWLRGLTDIMFFISISVTVVLIIILDWPPQFMYYMITPVVLLWLFSYTMIDWMVFAKEYFLNAWKEVSLYAVIFILTSFVVIRGFNYGVALEFGVILTLQSLVYMQKSSWSITMTWLISGCSILILANKGLWDSMAPIEWGLVTSIIVLILWNIYATFRLIPKGVDFAVTVALLWQDGTSLGCVLFTDAIHSAGHATPFVLKLLSWLSILFVFLPAIHRKDPSSLVLNICMALSVPFILLSTAYEPLFFLLVSNFMISWMLLEGYSDEGKTKRQLNGEDARRALLFVYFCFLSSKILGNTYSLISASIYSIRCFTETIYEPVVWMLLILKPVLIYAMITVIFLIICMSNGVKMDQGFNLVLLIYQFVGTTLFFQIQLNENGTLPMSSVAAAIEFFMVNICAITLITLVLICKYIYRLPMSKIM